MKLNEKTFSSLLSTIVTLEDSKLLQEELRLLSQSLYSGKSTNFEAVIANKVRRSVALAFKADLKLNGGDGMTFIHEAETFFTHLPVMELSLGFEPTAEEMVSIAQKARELAGIPLLISLTYKPYLIGGVELNINGEYRDYSLRTKMITLYQEMSRTSLEQKVKK